MRRGFAFLVAVAGLVGLSPSVYAQYAYPPVPYGPMPGYGYPPAMMQPLPPYGPNPMMARPVQYYPPLMQRAPMPMYYQPAPAPRVYNFGPLPEESVPAPVVTTQAALPTTSSSNGSSAPIAPVARPLSGWFKPHHAAPTEPALNACGPQGCPSGGCGDACGACGPACDTCAPVVAQPRPHPCGHFIGMAGAYFLVPYPANRSAFTTTNVGVTTTSQFENDLEVAPRFSLGYVFHNGWGARASFWFMHANEDANAFNNNPLTTVTTATPAPFRITSPSATLLLGIGADQFRATQTIQMEVGDVEIVKEGCCFGSTYLFGMGARYGRISQGYSATRVNAGGVNAGGVVVGSDRQDLNILSRFEGIGPTLSFDSVCPIYGKCLSVYGNARASALFGIERFYQDTNLQSNSVALGVFTPINTSLSNRTTNSQTAYNVELETGLQFGRRLGPCYVFSRAGIAAQQWWNVGNPTGTSGNLSFLGGTFQVGVAY